jgi:hypothetical protein
MASFELISALSGLDEKTPAYFRDEIFAHGDLTTRRLAIQILSNPDSGSSAARTLMNLLRVIPRDPHPQA